MRCTGAGLANDRRMNAAALWMSVIAVGACSKDKGRDEPPPAETPTVAVAPDAALSRDAADVAPVIVPDAVLAPTDDTPAAITKPQRAQLDAEIAALEALSKDVEAVDCTKAGAVLMRHWKGFKPVKALLREINA